MKIAYVHDQLLPTDDTAVEQLVNTIAGFVHSGAQGTLFLPRDLNGRCPNADEVRHFYDVDALFELKCLRSLFPSSRVPEKAAHALRAVMHAELRAYDVVYTRNIPFLFAGVAAGLPLVYETYRPWPTQYRPLAPFFRAAMGARSFLGAVLHSDYCREEYLHIGVEGARLRAIHNGYDPRRFQPRLSPRQARELLQIDEQRLIVGYAGRLLPGKGMSIVLEMARQRPDVVFMLVGSAGPGEIEERAATQHNVLVFPWQSYKDLPRYLFAADVLLIPPTLLALQKTRNTVLPMKLFQYLAAGRPVLAPEAPDTAELLLHGENAQLVAPDDISSACAGLDALSSSPARREELAAGARETAEGLTWDARSAKILAYIEERLALR